MPNWIPITAANVIDALQAPELDALRTAALGDTQGDPIGAAILAVVPRIRGYVASRPGNKLDQDDTLIPPELFQDGVWLVIQALKVRLGDATKLSTDQAALIKRAEDDLQKVALGTLRVSIPQNPQTTSTIQSGGGAEIVSSRSRMFGDMSGVTQTPVLNTLDGAGITDGVSTNGHYIDPAWLVSFSWLKLTDRPTTVASAGLTDAISTSALTAALTAALAALLVGPTFSAVPKAPTAAPGTATTQIATTAFVGNAVASLVNSSPAALDTLVELAAALGNDANFATTVTNALALKAPLISPALAGVPTAPTAAAGTSTTQIATTAFVGTAVANLVNSSPAALDTLAELAAALGNDANFATTVTNSLALKAPLASPTFTGPVTIPNGAVIGNHAPSADGGASIGTSVSAGRYDSIFAKTALKITGPAAVFELWNTNGAVSTANYEKFVIDWLSTPNTVTFGVKNGGTGTTQRNIIYDAALHRFDVAGSAVAYVQSSGLTPTADGSKSLGQQTAYRWDYIYAKSGIQITGSAGQFTMYNIDPGTSGGNNEYGVLSWSANAGSFTLGTYQTGTGLARTLRLQSANVLQLYATQGSSINAPSGTPPIDIRVNNVVKWNTNGNGDLIATSGIKLFLGASTTSNASLNIPAGTAPTTPTDGDIWSDGTNLKFRAGGATYTIQKA